MTDRPAMPSPIFEEEILPPGTIELGAAKPSRLAFPALIVGNVVLAIGPWFVRLADVGPIASGFWRLALAVPFLFLIARMSGRKFGRPSLGLWLMIAVGGLFFAADLAFWHIGILHTKLANSVLFGNIASLFFAGYGFFLARRLPSRTQWIAMLLASVGIMLLLGRSYELSRANLRMETWPVLTIATVFGAASLWPAAMAIDGGVMPHHWAPLFALALGSQVIGQGLVVYAIGALSPVVVGISLLCQPMVSALVGWIVYGERLTIGDLIGAAAIATALVLIRARD
jgi:drug/metabolite transporter (DMT)-like permease